MVKTFLFLYTVNDVTECLTNPHNLKSLREQTDKKKKIADLAN